MGVSIEEAVVLSQRHLFLVVDMAVSQEEFLSVVDYQRIIGQDREVQQHLVHFRVAVAPYRNDAVGHLIQSSCYFLRVEAFRNPVSRP